MKTRPITNDDLWACIRGCALTSLTKGDIITLQLEHDRSELRDTFAGRVYGEALRQVLTGRLYWKPQ